ncbi:MAG TPA: 50S ribosome-binding GTPase [Candidatus Pacearchaeota archaeon]|nr:50S ribosome-binding GTPase [Candidatus Pacearchaeota archaeon]HPZ74673.1 50S ribosome-binding GTPase [Candidatus Pacearchaeota archaeon]HQD89206.1 50S ribosome-binding GTPase [Candidatus Pacearchaeota archaeon]
MAANLPPYFFKLQERLDETADLKEKISILEEMLAVCPKHKGTEKVQKELKTKIAKLKKQKPKKIKSEVFYTVPKKGAGEVVIVGPANAGKSSLLNALTNAQEKVADYPFTTQFPKPAMMPFENILIQLVDTPPLTKDSPGWLKSLIFESDALMAVFDLSNPAVQKQIKEIKKLLEIWRFTNKKIIFVGNKFDLEISKKCFKQLKTTPKEKIVPVSAQKRTGLKELKKKIFETLEIVRVYSKKIGEEVNFENPFIAQKGTKLINLAEKINKDFVLLFKYARLKKKNSPRIQIVGKDYILEDEDIIEIHI